MLNLVLSKKVTRVFVKRNDEKTFLYFHCESFYSRFYLFLNLTSCLQFKLKWQMINFAMCNTSNFIKLLEISFINEFQSFMPMQDIIFYCLKKQCQYQLPFAQIFPLNAKSELAIRSTIEAKQRYIHIQRQLRTQGRKREWYYHLDDRENEEKRGSSHLNSQHISSGRSNLYSTYSATSIFHSKNGIFISKLNSHV